MPCLIQAHGDVTGGGGDLRVPAVSPEMPKEERSLAGTRMPCAAWSMQGRDLSNPQGRQQRLSTKPEFLLYMACGTD